MKGILWKGFFDGFSGYSTVTREYVRILDESGCDIKIWPLMPMNKNNPMNALIAKRKEDRFSIVHQIPPVFRDEDGMFTVTEFDSIPNDWWMPMLKAKLIMTQSNFCKDVFSNIPSIDKSKIHVVYSPTVSNMDNMGNKLEFDKKYDFLFGSVFEWVARKKPELMWQAFIEEFPIDEYPEVGFINKISIPHGFRDSNRMFNIYTNKDPRIHIFNTYVDDLGDFYRSLNCYCSPTAGEGWGQTLSEAMACGIPTIGSRHSGNLEFMNDSNSWLVDTEDWSYVGEDPINHLPLVHPWQRWKLPKVESIRKAMREIYDLKLTGKLNRRAIEGISVKEKMSDVVIAKQFKRAFEQFL